VKDNINLQASDIWESRDLSVEYIPNKKITFYLKAAKMPLFLVKLVEQLLQKNIQGM